MTDIIIAQHDIRREPSPRDCAHCGACFLPKNPRREHCSTLCRGRAKERRRREQGRVYPRKGNSYLHRLIYILTYGFFSLPVGWDVHHLSGYSNDPINLVALPHADHSRLTHKLRRGEDVTALLAPYLAFREVCFLRQSIIKEQFYPLPVKKVGVL